MAWNRIIGQQRVKDVLARLIETNTLPHALLFYGPSGVGQEPTALELAKVVNCETGKSSACGSCTSCRQFDELRHTRLKLVFPLPVKPGEDSSLEKLTPQELEEVNEQIALKAENPYHEISIAKANVIKVSSIRDIIRESAYRATGKGRTAVVIFEAEKMNQNASNALLKSLEEPTGDLLFILCASNRDAILPTIKSRCQQFSFAPLTNGEIEQGLTSEELGDPERVKTAAQLSSGSYSVARQIAVEGLGLDREVVRDYLRLIVLNRPVDIMSFLSNLGQNVDRRQVSYFLSLVQFWFRDIIALREKKEAAVSNVDLIDSLTKFAEHYPGADCAQAVEMIDNTIELINKNVHLINALLVLSVRLRQAVLSQGA